MATRKKRVERVQDDEREALVLEYPKYGAHPIFHDLEREEALRKTRGNKDLNVLMLRNLLEHAHDLLRELPEDCERRIQEAHDETARLSDELEDVKAKLDKDKDDVDRLESELVEAKTQVALLKGIVEELKPVEPAAMALVACWKAGLIRAGTIKSMFDAEQKEALFKGLEVLGISREQVN